MGRVYRAVDLSSGREVAVKVVKVGANPSPDGLKRFERENLTLRRIAHPDIIEYLGHGTDADVTYLVVSFVRGRSLLDAAPELRGRAGSLASSTSAWLSGRCGREDPSERDHLAPDPDQHHSRDDPLHEPRTHPGRAC